MPPRLIELKAAAEMLGLSADDLNEFRSQNEIFGYRDGATWKFKIDEIERFAQSRGIHVGPERGPKTEGGSGIDADLEELINVADFDSDDSSGDEASSLGDAASILVSEETLGKPGGGTVSTIIGKSDDNASADSDIQLADDGGSGKGGSDVELVAELDPSGSGVKLMPGSSDVLNAASGIGGSNVLGAQRPGKGPSDTAEIEDKVDSGLSLGESGLSLGDGDLSLGEDSLDLDGDIDLDAADVLAGGGSGSGSDVTQAADSGINLTNPSESGLSLEDEPLELGGSAIESLELGEDDMVPLEEEAADPDAATQLKADDDFLLTPVEDVGGEESDSGSQVIALDTEEFDESGEGLLAAEVGAEPLLEEEAALAAGADMFDESGAAALAGAAPLLQPKQAVEAPYSVWNVLSLMFIVVLLSLTGMMMVDLLRNMWSWDGTYASNSALMDWIIETIGG